MKIIAILMVFLTSCAGVPVRKEKVCNVAPGIYNVTYEYYKSSCGIGDCKSVFTTKMSLSGREKCGFSYKEYIFLYDKTTKCYTMQSLGFYIDGSNPIWGFLINTNLCYKCQIAYTMKFERIKL